MAVYRYREFLPCTPLRKFIRAFFVYSPETNAVNAGLREPIREVLRAEGESSWSALFADSDLSVVFSYGEGYSIGDLWTSDRHSGHVIGPMSTFRSTSPGRSLFQVGTYIRAGFARSFLYVPGSELRDRVVALSGLWPGGGELDSRIGEAASVTERVRLLEQELLRRFRPITNGRACDAAGLARRARYFGGQMTVDSLARDAGVSRQYLNRVFAREVGVSPKLHLRLSRFRRSLPDLHAAAHGAVARIASEAGYFDQAHMTAEFRTFCGMTPGALVRTRPFHPFTYSQA